MKMKKDCFGYLSKGLLIGGASGLIAGIAFAHWHLRKQAHLLIHTDPEEYV